MSYLYVCMSLLDDEFLDKRNTALFITVPS